MRATVLRSGSDPEDLDSSSETLLLEVEDVEGRVGIGEADTASRAGAALVDMEDVHRWNGSFRGVLLGADPFATAELWARMAERTSYAGPSGIARHTLAGLDIALHDLAGKQLGRPAFHLLGGARREYLSPYATAYAGAARDRPLGELMESSRQLLERALAAGFRAVKLELIFEGAAGDRQLVDCIREARRTVGEAVELLVDFGYRWRHWRDALAVLRAVEDCRLWLVEAALSHDDLTGHARLAARAEPRIGGAELATTLEECVAWLEVGRVDVLQPDVARAGRPHRDAAHRRVRRRARRGSGAALLEDRHQRRRRPPPPGGEPERPAHRGVDPGAVRFAAPPRAGARRAHAARRAAPASRPSGARHRARARGGRGLPRGGAQNVDVRPPSIVTVCAVT